MVSETHFLNLGLHLGIVFGLARVGVEVGHNSSEINVRCFIYSLDQ